MKLKINITTEDGELLECMTVSNAQSETDEDCYLHGRYFEAELLSQIRSYFKFMERKTA